jgi:hypothetical protein
VPDAVPQRWVSKGVLVGVYMYDGGTNTPFVAATLHKAAE